MIQWSGHQVPERMMCHKQLTEGSGRNITAAIASFCFLASGIVQAHELELVGSMEASRLQQAFEH